MRPDLQVTSTFLLVILGSLSRMQLATQFSTWHSSLGSTQIAWQIGQ